MSVGADGFVCVVGIGARMGGEGMRLSREAWNARLGLSCPISSLSRCLFFCFFFWLKRRFSFVFFPSNTFFFLSRRQNEYPSLWPMHIAFCTTGSPGALLSFYYTAWHCAAFRPSPPFMGRGFGEWGPGTRDTNLTWNRFPCREKFKNYCIPSLQEKEIFFPSDQFYADDLLKTRPAAPWSISALVPALALPSQEKPNAQSQRRQQPHPLHPLPLHLGRFRFLRRYRPGRHRRRPRRYDGLGLRAEENGGR